MTDVIDLMMAFRKSDLILMARDLSVTNEINGRDSKTTIAADLSQVLDTSDVLGWADLAGFKVKVS